MTRKKFNEFEGVSGVGDRVPYLGNTLFDEIIGEAFSGILLGAILSTRRVYKMNCWWDIPSL